MTEASLKLLTARSVKWNAIDRLASQVLYAATGIVLANKLPPYDFGLVGAVMIFQAFASLLVDSGFSYALIQRKHPTEIDYSSVLWFNVGMALIIYGVLWVCAPLIADCFEHEQTLVPLSRAVFVTFILNATSIVQVNRLTKQMHVRPIAVANLVSLAAGGVVGIMLAFMGYGAWSIVWQSIVSAGLKSLILWVSTRWRPLMRFSWSAIRSFFGVGSSMMLSSLLNTVFLTIYSFFIGHRAGIEPLAYYTQGDKWSKMGIMSLMQTLTSSFLPPLSAVQDEHERYLQMCSKMNRMTAYLVFPAMVGLMVMAAPIFHTLFGTKWDASIALFQLLCARGMFTVITGVYNNYLIAVGRTRLIMILEMVRDAVALVALAVTLPYIALESGGDIVYGIKILLYGQILAAAVAWALTLACVCRTLGASPWGFLSDLVPYIALTALIAPVLAYVAALDMMAVAVLALQVGVGGALYIGLNWLLRSRIQSDIIAFLRHKKI